MTEYGNPAPNTYGSEGHLLRAAYAALQDRDYISASRYSHSAAWDLRRINNFFDIHQHPTKMATLVPAAALFLRGDVKAARQLVVARLGKEQKLAAEAGSGGNAVVILGPERHDDLVRGRSEIARRRFPSTSSAW